MDKGTSMFSLLALIAFTMVIQCSGTGLVCKEDVDCNDKNSERCQTYDACDLGWCVCKEGYTDWKQYSSSPPGVSGVCFKLLNIGDSCANDTGTCGTAVKCWNGKCECRSSDYEEASDGYNCVAKPLSGNLAAGSSCAAVGSFCGGGSNCISNTCTCPDRSSWSSTWKSCIHDNSKTGLEEGARCEKSLTINSYWSSMASRPYLYCGDKLLCGLCPEDGDKTGYPRQVCAKDPFSGADRVVMTTLTIVMATLGVTLSAV